MFKNNSSQYQPHNYSFCDQNSQSKQNNSLLSNYLHKDTNQMLMEKMDRIEKMMNKQIQMQIANSNALRDQNDAIVRIQRNMEKIFRVLGSKDVGDLERTGDKIMEKMGDKIGQNTSRMKSSSVSSCRTKRSTEKTLNTIEQRKKAINQQISKRICDQLDVKIQKKPIRYYLPTQN